MINDKIEYLPPIDLSSATVAYGLARLLGLDNNVADISEHKITTYVVTESEPAALHPAKRVHVARLDKSYANRSFQITLLRNGIGVTSQTLDQAIADVLPEPHKGIFLRALSRRQL